MKKFLKLSAIFTLVGALFVGCISNELPDGLKEVYLAKAEYLRAKAAHENAMVKVEEAEAAYRLAQAEFEKARAALVNAKADYVKQKADAEKIKNDYEKGILNAKIAAGIAKLQREEQEELYKLELEKKKTLQAQYDYLKELINLESSLADAKIIEFWDIANQIEYYLTQKAILENQLLAVKYERIVYEYAWAPTIKAQLEHNLEKADFLYTFWKNAMDLWNEIKALTIAEYKDYAAKMKAEMEGVYESFTSLRQETIYKRSELAKLEAAETAAKWDYDYSGLQNISIPNVFSTVADDMFKWWTTVNNGTTIEWVFTGVINNTYSFYGDEAPIINRALVGAKNSLNILIQDSIFIERNRIINGVEGWAEADAILAARLKSKNDAYSAYTTACTAWKTNYEVIKGGTGNWATERTNYNTALTNFKSYFGVDAADYDAFWDKGTGNGKALPGSRPSSAGSGVSAGNNQIAYDIWKAYIDFLTLATDQTGINPYNSWKYLSMVAGALNDPNAVTALLLAPKLLGGAEMPVSFLYYLEKKYITEYVKVVKDLMVGTTRGEWDLSEVELSDVLGKITFSPEQLLTLVWGSTNYKAVNYIINLILDAAYAADIVSAINALMPAYYTKANAFGNFTAPIMQKYNVAKNIEYHLWFLIYILFENRQINVGHNILVINKDNYTDAVAQILKDFVGYNTTDYPGKYYYKSTPAQALGSSNATLLTGTAVAKSDRFDNPGTHAVVAGVIDAENALRLKYLGWGRSWERLCYNDKNLYTPYYRTWPVTGYTTWTTAGWSNTAHAALTATGLNVDPWWIAHAAATVKVDLATANHSSKFYFMPEKSNDPYYPSLVNGEMLYWTRNYVPFGTVENRIPAYYMNWNHYYPSIAFKRVYLEGTQWNHWITIGLPVYQGDIVLWGDNTMTGTPAPDNNDATKWENNGTLPSAYVAKAFITERNYKQYKFWYDENKAGSYDKLLVSISAEIAKLRPVVQDLLDKWTAAAQARVYKEYEVRSMYHEGDMYETYFYSLMGIYNKLWNAVNDDLWDGSGAVTTIAGTHYDLVLTMYTQAIEDLREAEKDLEYFNKTGWDPILMGGENRIVTLDAKIAGLNAKISTINDILQVLETEKQTILTKVVVK